MNTVVIPAPRAPVVILVLAVVCVLLLAWLAVMCLACYGLFLRLREVEELARSLARRDRHQRETIRRYRAEFWALADVNTPPAAVAALTPDAEPPIPSGWLDDLNDLPTTHEREYPL